MAGFVPIYAASAAVFGANDLDGLASSGTLVAGRASAVITNASNDVLLTGRFKANNTAPTAGKIEIWVGGVLNDTPTYPDVFDGTSSAKTVTSADIKYAVLKLAATIRTDATANRIYEFAPVSLAELFGGVPPKQWWAWVTHSMVQALNTTTGNGGQCWYQTVTFPA